MSSIINDPIKNQKDKTTYISLKLFYASTISISTWQINDLLVRAVVHKSDTVSVSVACSLAPVAVDIKGLIRLSNALTRVEERLAILLTDIGDGEGYRDSCPDFSVPRNTKDSQRPKIPNHQLWVVTMWHFGVDSLVEYTGDKFASAGNIFPAAKNLEKNDSDTVINVLLIVNLLIIWIQHYSNHGIEQKLR